MAGQCQSELSHKAVFRTVKLFKDQVLGIGAYGKVCKAKCDGLLCAAKLIHETLCAPQGVPLLRQNAGRRLPIKRFEREIEFLSTISHPNIVQHLGVYQDPETRLPVLLMELMDDSLTHFLEGVSMGAIPYYVQLDLCHDIVLALTFLHSNKIIHRDLSGNNILLVGNGHKAKVTDFGMARLNDPEFQGSGHTHFTMCPGADVYMPPEAVENDPEYTEKIDCFSFGVIIVQILTKLYPKPGDRHKRAHVQVSHPGLPKGRIEVRISELERREDHISKIDPCHPLLPIAHTCLSDDANDRPSAWDMCERIEGLKENWKYRESQIATETPNFDLASKLQERLEYQEKQYKQEIDDLKRRIQSLSNHLENDYVIIEESPRLQHSVKVEGVREGEIAAVVEDQVSRQVNEEDRKQIKLHQQQAKGNERSKSEFKKEIAELDGQKLKTCDSGASSSGVDLKFRWKRGICALCEMNRYSNAVFDGGKVYLIPADTREIHTYNTVSHEWSQFSSCQYLGSSLTVIKNLVTTIGGKRAEMGYRYPVNTTAGYESSYISKLCSFTKTGNGGTEWTEKFPNMPTRRAFTTALNTGTNLIVAGGVGGVVLTTVEIMNVEMSQWWTATDLPQPMWAASATVCGDCVYVLGGLDRDSSGLSTVFTCSLETLLQYCQSRSLGSRLASVLSLNKPTVNVWSRLANVPVTHSTCVSVHGHLLAVGGKDSNNKPTTDIHMYNQATNTWVAIDHMPVARHSCFALIHHHNKLIVVGGKTTKGTATNKMNIATVTTTWSPLTLT